MMESNNTIHVYTSAEPGGLTISSSNVRNALSVTNDRARYYAELAEQFKNDVKQMLEEVKYYAAQNTNVTMEVINNLESDLLEQISGKQDAGDYALSSELPVNVSDLNNDADYVDEESLQTALDDKIDLDYSNADYTPINKAGDTITGDFIYTKDDATTDIRFERDDIIAGMATSSGNAEYAGSLYGIDGNANTITMMRAGVTSTGASFIQLAARKPDLSSYGTTVQLWTDNDGSHFQFPRCTTKATTTSTASNSLVAVVVTNYRNGNNWYRVWSDGWIEQGYSSSAAETVPKTFTYLKTFTQTPYLVVNVWDTSSSTSGTQVRNFGYERSTTGFKVSAGSNSYRFSWYACGY